LAPMHLNCLLAQTFAHSQSCVHSTLIFIQYMGVVLWLNNCRALFWMKHLTTVMIVMLSLVSPVSYFSTW
jgi:hypothetical protein